MSKKLFILTRRDFPIADQAVQSGHAVAQFLINHPYTEWNNGTLIYLGVKDEETLKRWTYKLHLWKAHYATFYEPDMNNELTSVASDYDESFFKNLQML